MWPVATVLDSAALRGIFKLGRLGISKLAVASGQSRSGVKCPFLKQ